MRILSNVSLRALTFSLSATLFSLPACTTTPRDGARNTTSNRSLLGASGDAPDNPEVAPDSAPDAGAPNPDEGSGAVDEVECLGALPTDTGVSQSFPSGIDSDGDGFSDDIETGSSDPFFKNLAANGANPQVPDVFIYIDFYYIPPNDNTIDLIVQAFADAPLTNEFKAHGINLHVIIANSPIPEEQQVQNLQTLCPSDGGASDWTAFDKIKANNFPAEWQKIAHYVLWADEIGGEGARSGCSRGVPGHDLVVSLGGWKQYQSWDMVQAGTLMHELGHNLGLLHDGRCELQSTPNYLSVMNYNYQMVGLPLDTGEFVLDYSRMPMGPMNEQGLNEADGLNDSGLPHEFPYTAGLVNYQALFGYQYTNAAVGADGSPFDAWLTQLHPVAGAVGDWIDFNDNGTNDGTIPPFDLDGNGKTTDAFPATWNDWENLQFQGAADGGGVIGDGVPEQNPRYVVRLGPSDPLHELGSD